MHNLLCLDSGIKLRERFGRLRVIGTPFYGVVKSASSPRGYQRTRFCVCRCQCGRIDVFRVSNLKSELTTGCGCGAKRHGLADHPLYGVWRGIVSRCKNAKSHAYSRYGGRGIAVCRLWRADPASFIAWAEAKGYKKGLHVDRRNNDLGYSPSNCRIVTPVENARNRSDNRMLTAFGETKAMSAWSEDARCVVSYGNLKARLNSGWSTKTALTRPKRGR